MQQFRFIFIVLLTSLLVPSVAFLRLDSFSNRSKIASAATPAPKQVDLSGTWVESGTLVTIDGKGCTAGYSGNLSIGGQDSQHRIFNLKRSGNQLIFPTAITTTWGSGSGTQFYKGTVSGKTVTYVVSGDAGGGFTAQYTGTISNDGNKVTGEGTCKSPRGSATADVNFTWIRKSNKGVTVYVWDYTGVLKSLGHASMRLNDVDKTYVSWWPEGGLRGFPYVVSKAATHTFEQDIKVEGHPPNHTIEIPCLDEEKIKTWWADFRRGNEFYCPVSFIFNSTANCAGVVEKGLIAGGAADVLPDWKIFIDHPIGSTIGVRPQSILEIAEELKNKCPIGTK